MKAKIHVPIFNAVVWLVVDKDIKSERRKMEHWFGPVLAGDHYDALCSYGSGHNFALFFEPAALLRRDTLAHEIFHLTHRILDWAGVTFNSCHHEAGALLNGWLHDEITWRLRKQKGRRL